MDAGKNRETGKTVAHRWEYYRAKWEHDVTDACVSINENRFLRDVSVSWFSRRVTFGSHYTDRRDNVEYPFNYKRQMTNEKKKSERLF